MTTDFWIIRAITNLHPGRGDASFGVVDKQVQRDATNNLPTIFGSSVKGALRQLFDLYHRGQAVSIFGSDIKLPEGQAENTPDTKTAAPGKQATRALQQGSHIFFNAQLLAIPIRATHDFFYLATCPGILADRAAELRRFGHAQAEAAENLHDHLKEKLAEHPAVYFGKSRLGLRLENIRPVYVAAEEEVITGPTALAFFGKEARLAVLSNEEFARYIEDLPVVARNYLENGVSANLWYEEFVPRESRFLLPVAHPENDNTLATGLAMESIDHHVQIGANATVGLGFTAWTALN